MREEGQRYVGAFMLLVLVWVGVFWWWEPTRDDAVTFQPPITDGAPPVAAAADTPPPEPLRVAPALPAPTVVPEAPSPAPQAAGVLAPEFRETTVRAGDTFATIAQRELGSRSLAPLIARANPLKDPRRLRIGEVLRVPVDPANIQGLTADRRGEPREAPATIEYTVQRGDTLGTIARRFYGSSRFTQALFEANRDRLRSPDEVRLGQVIRIPPPSDVGAGEGG